MKIKKLLPNEVQEKTLGYKDYRKVLKPALKQMASTCNSPETATDFLIKTDYEFSDMPGKKMGLIIPGKQTGAWLKMAKEEIKKDKKFTMVGKCYIKTADDGSQTIVLTPTKGAAKAAIIKKQLPKFALKGLPFGLHLGELAEEMETEEEASETDTNVDEEAIKKKNLMAARMKKMDEQIAKIKAQLKIS